MKTNRDYGQLLMWAAILVSAPRWAGAFIAADAHTIPPLVDSGLQILNLVSGAGMGLIEVLGTAYLLDAWGRMRSRKTWNAKHVDQRWLILTFFVAGLFVLMPLILAPYMVARMNGQALADVADGWFGYVWAVATVLSPVFIVGGVAVARDGLVGVKKLEQELESKPARASTERAKKPVVEPEPAQSGHLCQACEKEFGSVQALNAHQRFCTARVPASANGVSKHA